MDQDAEAAVFEVREVDRPPAGGPFELEVITEFLVIEQRTGAVALRFEGRCSASWDDGHWGEGQRNGVVKVVLDEPQRQVVVHHADGRTEAFALPDC